MSGKSLGRCFGGAVESEGGAEMAVDAKIEAGVIGKASPERGGSLQAAWRDWKTGKQVSEALVGSFI